jgi:cell division protein FtsN
MEHPIKLQLPRQSGSTTLGIIVGVVLGLAVALGVSLYLATSSMPIKDKASNPAAKSEPLAPKDISKAPDPNQSLYTKSKVDDDKPADPQAVPAKALPDLGTAPVSVPAPAQAGMPAKPAAQDDAIGKIAAVVTPAKPAAAPVPSAAAKPTALLNASKTASTAVIDMPPASPPGSAGERYFVQAGAYKALSEAEAMKAKLALQGVVMQLSARDTQSGPIHRVRTAPLAAADAEKLAAQLKVNGLESSLVKVQ